MLPVEGKEKSFADFPGIRAGCYNPFLGSSRNAFIVHFFRRLRKFAPVA
jgi:hypothetical protein